MKYIQRYQNILFILIASGFIFSNMISCKDYSKFISFQLQIVDSIPPKNPWAKIAADVNSDGLEDLVVGGQNGPLVWYQSPTWEKHEIVKGGYSTVDGEAGDINRDGFMDIIMGGVFWYENPGNLNTNPDQIWRIHKVADHPTHDVELGDINNDGLLDIVTRNQSDFGHKLGNSIHIWYQKSDSIWEEDIINCSHGEGIRVIDLEDDGDADIVIGESWFENKGGKQKVEWERHGYAEWYKANCVDVADLNGDGYKDIILTPSELANNYYRISWFEAPKTLPDGRWVEHVLSDSTECVIHSLRVNDFNDDNLPDILYAEMHQGTDPDEVVLMMNKKHGKSWTKKIISTNGSHMLQLIDYDQDGDLDFFGANWSGPFQPVQLWENISGK